MRTAKKLALTVTLIELVPTSPKRKSFIVQNMNDTEVIAIYVAEEPSGVGSFFIEPGCWVQFEKDDDAAKQWWVRTVSGSGYAWITEFFEEPSGWIW